MLFQKLSAQEKQAIRDAIIAVLVSPDIPPDESHTRYGVAFEGMKQILRKWPHLDEQDLDTRLTITGCLNEVCHGIAFDDDPDVVGLKSTDWLNWFSMSKEEMRILFQQWRKLTRKDA